MVFTPMRGSCGVTQVHMPHTYVEEDVDLTYQSQCCGSPKPGAGSAWP